MTGLTDTSYEHHHYSGEVGPSSSSFHYRFYPSEASLLGIGDARLSFALRAPVAGGVDGGTDEHDDITGGYF